MCESVGRSLEIRQKSWQSALSLFSEACCYVLDVPGLQYVASLDVCVNHHGIQQIHLVVSMRR